VQIFFGFFISAKKALLGFQALGVAKAF